MSYVLDFVSFIETDGKKRWLLFFFLLLRPFLKWTTAGDAEKGMGGVTPQMLPKTVAEIEAAVLAKRLAEGGTAASVGLDGAEGSTVGMTVEEAEKLEQAILWQWSRRQLAGRLCIDHNRALAANLRSVLEFYGVAVGEAEATVQHLLEAATAYAQSIR